MESLRCCEVGSYLKSPKFPVWILGSEVNLTVFFAKDLALDAPKGPSEHAKCMSLRIMALYLTLS